MNVIDVIFINPIINILVAFYQLLSLVHIPFALGFSIMLMTGFIRLLMFPLSAHQIKISKKMQDLAPHMAKIKEKHKGDMRKQQEATIALYREHNVNPAAGCLPTILQIVILIFGLFPALQKILTLAPKDTVRVVNDIVYFPFLHISQPWDTNFFGFMLGKTPSELFATLGPIVLIIPVLTGVLQFVQSKMMMADNKETKVPAVKNQQEDFATAFQKQSLYILPIMVGFFAYTFSVGLSLYWNTFSLFGIIQQYRISGWGGMATLLKKK